MQEAQDRLDSLRGLSPRIKETTFRLGCYFRLWRESLVLLVEAIRKKDPGLAEKARKMFEEAQQQAQGARQPK